MKRRLSVLAYISSVVLSAMPLSAQAPLVPAEEAALPVPTVSPVKAVLDNAAAPNGLQQQGWVTLDSSGAVHGTYAQLNNDGSPRRVADRVAIHLTRNGSAVQSTLTAADGSFSVAGLQAGTYALIAKSASSVAAFTLHVLPAGASGRLESNFVVFGTSLGASEVSNLVRTHATPSASTGSSNSYYPDLQSDPLGDARHFSTGAQVRLRSGNQLVGRIARPGGAADLSGNMVHIMSAGKVVGNGVTSASGEFQIEGITPGVYDIVVAGKDGVAVSAFRAVDGEPGLSMKSAGDTRLVSALQPASSDTLTLEMVSPGDYFVGDSGPQVLPPEVFGVGFGAAVPGGGFAGPGGFPGGGFGGGIGGGVGGGGGGGVGGGRGLGALLGIGGLAAGIAALVSNNDDNEASR